MKEAGFTLVELLVALVAGALLLAALGSMAGMFGTELRRSSYDTGFEQIAAAAPLLETLLSTARSGTSDKPLEVSSDHLDATVDPPLAQRGRGPLRLALDVVHEAAGEALQVSLGPSRDEAAGSATTRWLVVGMKAIEIKAERDRDDAAAKPPQLIELQFTTVDNAMWEIAIEPRLTASGGCQFDPISMTCRH